jgi:hypothetical protein
MQIHGPSIVSPDPASIRVDLNTTRPERPFVTVEFPGGLAFYLEGGDFDVLIKVFCQAKDILHAHKQAAAMAEQEASGLIGGFPTVADRGRYDAASAAEVARGLPVLDDEPGDGDDDGDDDVENITARLDHLDTMLHELSQQVDVMVNGAGGRQVTADLRGLDLLDAAIDHIEKHPETWDQTTWRCRTGMCLAGHIAILAGGRWAAATGCHLVREPGEPADPYLSLESVRVSCRAERLIGARILDGDEDDEDDRDLFDANNTLDDIKAMRDKLRAGAR